MKDFFSGKRGQWLLFIVLLAGLIWYGSANREDFAVIAEVDLAPLVALSALAVVTNYLMALRYLYVYRSFGTDMRQLSWLRVFIVGRLLNLFLPQTGNAYRAVSLKQSWGLSYTNYLAAFLAYTYLDRLLSIAFALGIVLVSRPGLRMAGAPAWLILAGLLALGVGLLVGTRSYFRDRPAPPPEHRWRARLYRLSTGTLNAIHHPTTLIIMVTLGLTNFALGMYANLLAFGALDLQVDPARLAVYTTVKHTLGAVMFTPGNMGVYEAAYGLIGGGMEQVAAHAILAAALLHATGILTTVVVGLPVFGVERLAKRRRER
jgi:uncharacterized membrane protein YbhN (UPF0104 family)